MCQHPALYVHLAVLVGTAELGGLHPVLPACLVPRTAGLTGTSAIGVLAKIESADSVEHLDEILDAGKRGAVVVVGAGSW